MNLEVIKGLLKNTGIRIDTVLSGREAIEAAKKQVYDILFIDHRMPDMDGIETLHALKKLNNNLNAEKPCIALTANAISGVKKMYLNEGFDDYISKPVNPQKLEELIRHYLPNDYLEENVETEIAENKSNEYSDFLNNYKNIKELDAEIALKNCGSPEILTSIVNQFYSTIEEKALELQQYFEAEDWKNYGIKVHALKSTSRLIGAVELSKLSEYLEDCSNNNTAEIKNRHKELITTFLNQKDILKTLISDDSDNSQKTEISQEELTEKIKLLSEYADTFDIDGLDNLIFELSSRILPLDFSQKFSKIRQCVKNVDFKELRILLSEWSNR